MSVSNQLCYFLNYTFDKILRVRPIYHMYDASRYNSPVADQLNEIERAPLEWNFYKNHIPTLENKTILDIGCGFGGRTAYYALKGAKVIGIDIKKEKFKTATLFAKMQNVEEQTIFQLADGTSLPFKTDTFDIVMSNNAMQYVSDPVECLKEAKRVTKPGGLMCINFGPPWYAPICPELGQCFPWTHLLFSQETIKKTFYKLGKEKDGINQSLDGDIFKSNNKITIKQFRNILNSANYHVLHFKLWTRPYVSPMIYFPFLKEYFCAQVISVSRKI